ncbi:hypothetical protein [Desulfocurvus sp. DL9XJH121]
MEHEWHFTQYMLGFCVLVLAMRAGGWLASRSRAFIRGLWTSGDREFYCFFPTRTFGGTQRPGQGEGAARRAPRGGESR